MPLVIEGPAFRDYAAPQPIFRAGQAVMAPVADLLAGTGYGLILTDRQGVVLHMAGERELAAAAERVGSLPGAVWREDLVGNNAIGTALSQAAPAEFHLHEHWCAGWTDWTCAAAPVRAPASGAVLGAISVCGHRRPHDSGMLVMAVRLAGTIERQLEREVQTRQAALVAEARKLRRWFPGRMALAIDCDGCIAHVEGSPPAELTRYIAASPLALLPAKLRGEKEVVLAGRFPCLAIPIWDELTWLGHLLIVGDPVQPKVERLIAVKDGRKLLFAPEQVLAVRIAGGRAVLLTESGEWPTPYETIGECQERLPAAGFFQVDRNCLVNLAWVKEIHPMFGRTVNLVLSDRKATQIPVSRRRTAALREILEF